MINKRVGGVVLLLLSAFALDALAARDMILRPQREVLPDVEEYVWKEKETKLPEWPQDEDLLEFEVELPNTPFRYYIDTRSFSYDPVEGVVRYTLVIRSRRGGENVTYEGLRCNTSEYKVYAYGNGKGVMRPARNPTWQHLIEAGHTRYRTDLKKKYFCGSGTVPVDARIMLDNLRYDRKLREDVMH